MQNQLRGFTIYYTNIRDLKSKEESFKEIVNELKPTVIAITETWLTKGQEVELEGYVIFRNDRLGGEGGGILVAVRAELKNVAIESSRTNERFESIWIVINNTKTKIKIGVIYMPQESKTTKEEMKEIYKEIKQEIHEGKVNSQKLLILGDMNCKIGDAINGNNSEVTKGGKELMKMIEKEHLAIVNASPKCTGMWTRDENGSKAVLDYVLIEEDELETVEKMIIDEGRVVATSRIKEDEGTLRTVYSDHNVISIRLNWIDLEKERHMQTSTRKFMTKEGRLKYTRDIQEAEISKIWDKKGTLQKRYDEWTREVDRIRQNNEKEVKRKKTSMSKQGRLMNTLRKKLKKERKEATEDEERERLQAEIDQLKKDIHEEEKQSKVRKIEKVVQEIRCGGQLNGGAFWKLKKKLTKKKADLPHAVYNKDGVKVEEVDKIKGAYEEFYADLLETRPAETIEEERAEEEVNKIFNGIMKLAEQQKPMKVSDEEVECVVKSLKRRKAADREGWRNEDVLEGGEEMKKSITKLTNQILESYSIPAQWNNMTINSIHKKGDIKKLKNKRGLFLTNIISKVFEKMVDSKTEVEFDKGQHGGKKKRDKRQLDNTHGYKRQKQTTETEYVCLLC